MLRTNSMSCSTTTTVWSPARLFKKLGRLFGLFVGHARDRLVHEQHTRLLRQQHADLEPLLLAVGQQPRALLRLVLEADDLEHALDLLPLRTR